MKKEIIDSVFEKMKEKDFGESMCNETKLRVLKWCDKQLHKHFVSQRSELFSFSFLARLIKIITKYSKINVKIFGTYYALSYL